MVIASGSGDHCERLSIVLVVTCNKGYSMPYEIRRKGSRYQVVNKETGKVHSTTTKANAERQLRLLQGVERGWEPTGDSTYSKTVKGQKVNLRIK